MDRKYSKVLTIILIIIIVAVIGLIAFLVKVLYMGKNVQLIAYINLAYLLIKYVPKPKMQKNAIQ